MNIAIATELKAWRIRRNLDLAQVAKDNNVSYETMRKYEKGQTNISIEFVEKMLDYYKIDMKIFFDNICEYMHSEQINPNKIVGK